MNNNFKSTSTCKYLITYLCFHARISLWGKDLQIVPRIVIMDVNYYRNWSTSMNAKYLWKVAFLEKKNFFQSCLNDISAEIYLRNLCSSSEFSSVQMFAFTRSFLSSASAWTTSKGTPSCFIGSIIVMDCSANWVNLYYAAAKNVVTEMF